MTTTPPELLLDQVHVWLGQSRETVLASYLGIAARDIEFRLTERGKPELEGRYEPALHFNVSHSGMLEAVALARREVGIDIEQIDSSRGIDGIAERFFTPGELADLQSAPSEQRVERFYRLWTIKEAKAKLVGLGLAGLQEPDLPDVRTAPLELPDGYVGCVAVAGDEFSVLQISS